MNRRDTTEEERKLVDRLVEEQKPAECKTLQVLPWFVFGQFVLLFGVAGWLVVRASSLTGIAEVSFAMLAVTLSHRWLARWLVARWRAHQRANMILSSDPDNVKKYIDSALRTIEHILANPNFSEKDKTSLHRQREQLESAMADRQLEAITKR